MTILLVSACLLTGCTSWGPTDSAGEGVLAEAEGRVENLNSLNPNSLNLNSLNLNSLNLNSLDPDALASITDPTAKGALSRDALRYIIGCAFSSTQSFSFTWYDLDGIAHDETYWGLLGLAPQWESGPITLFESQWVSACMVSRVNWYTTPVMISSRASHPQLDDASTSELNAYPNMEGAFWGTLFQSLPVAYACYDGANVSHSRDSMRDCAAGHSNGDGTTSPCGIIQILGDCATVCGTQNPTDGYYLTCSSGTNGSTPRAITVFLP